MFERNKRGTKNLVGNSTGKNLSETYWCRRADNIKIDPKKTGFILHRIRISAGFCELGNEPSGSVEVFKFLYQLDD